MTITVNEDSGKYAVTNSTSGESILLSMQKNYKCTKHGEIGGAICTMVSNGIKGLETVYPVTMCAFCYAEHLRAVIGEVTEIPGALQAAAADSEPSPAQ